MWSVKKTVLIGAVIGIVLGFLLAFLTTHTVFGLSEDNGWGQCVSTGSQCGTDNGTQSKTVYADAVGICPTNYHYQNTGNWNERCHRNERTEQPNCWVWHINHWQATCDEHKSPTGATCPESFTLSGDEDSPVCSKVIEQSCQTGNIDYSACTPEEDCPTACGLKESEVPNGQGGFKECNATPACEEDVCSNIDGVQTSTPEGYTNDDGICTPIEEPKDVCSNIEGVQVTTPEGYTNDDGICTKVEEPKKEEKHENTFDKDTRCLDSTPPVPSWVKGEDGSPANNWHPPFTWSAEGGDTVQFRFSEDPNDLRWSFKTENDGHEIMGFVEPDNSGILGNVHYYWQMRTINGCKESPWTDVIKVFN